MAYDVFKKYVWLIDQVNNEEGKSLRQINEEWKKNTALSGGQDLSRFSFIKFRKAIKQYFGLDIYCENDRYYIAAPDQPSATMLTLMEKMAIDNMLEEFANLKGRIVYEPDLRAAKGRLKEEEKLRKVAEAMSKGRKLRIVYQPFGKEPETRTVHPYCVKMHQQRMYLHGRAENPGRRRTYCMDERMISVRMTEEKFQLPNGFDAEEYFRNAFGIVPYTEEIKPQTVRLRATPTLAGYLKGVKLHPSQEILEETKDHTDFVYYLAPTIDFLEEILRRRGDLQVLEPLELVDKLLLLLDSTKKKLEEGRNGVLKKTLE
jgi:predicted DNA-binding transcriptional regulator YafY